MRGFLLFIWMKERIVDPLKMLPNTIYMWEAAHQNMYSKIDISKKFQSIQTLKQ
jgi:hypothetical protein